MAMNPSFDLETCFRCAAEKSEEPVASGDQLDILQSLTKDMPRKEKGNVTQSKGGSFLTPDVINAIAKSIEANKKKAPTVAAKPFAKVSAKK